MHVAALIGYVIALGVFLGANYYIAPGKAFAANGNFSQTTFSGSDGTYTNTTPINSGADVALNPVLSNAGGSGWLYKRPITVTNGSGGPLTDYPVAVTPFSDSTFVNNTSLNGSWHFSEGAGTTTVDKSGNVNSGTMNGTSYWTAGATDGKSGYGFNAVAANSNFVNVPDSTNLKFGTGNFSVSAWVKQTNTTGTQNIVTKGVSGSGISYLPIYQLAIVGGKVSAYVDGNNASGQHYASCTGATTLSTGTWNLVTLVRTGATISTYLNGNATAECSYTAVASTGSSDTTEPLMIGRERHTSAGYRNYFNGVIDDVKVYGRALAGAEAAVNYGATGTTKIRTDFQDIRFANSVTGVEYPYWQENDGKFWVKVNSLPNGTNTNFLNMYYGNASATPTSNGSNIFALYDDFESYGIGALGTQGGWVSSAGTNGFANVVAGKYFDSGITSGTDGQDGTASHAITAMNAGEVSYRFKRDSTSNNYSYFVLSEGATARFQIVGSNSGEIKYIGGAYPWTSLSPVTNWVNGTWYTITVKWYSNSTADIYVNGVLKKTAAAFGTSMVTAIDKVTFTTSSSGDPHSIHLGTDDVRVRKATTTEPTHTAPGTEVAAYNTTGSYTTAVQAPAGVYNWGALTYTKTTPGSSTATIDVLNGTNDAVISSNVASGTNLNLSGLTYPSLKIKVNYTTSAVGNIPTLSQWDLVYSADTTPPSVPTGLTIGTATSSAIPLTWSGATDGESGVLGYEISRAPDSAGNPGTWAAVATDSPCYGAAGVLNAISCTDSSVSTPLLSNSKYFYRVRAKDNAGNFSGYSGEQNVDASTVGLWHLNEGTGATTADSSGINQTGTMNGTSYWTTGKVGGGLAANTNNNTSVTSTAALKPSNFTVEAWFYATSDQNSKILVSKYAALPADYEISIDVNDYLNVRSDTAGSVAYYATDNVVFTNYLNGWHHVAGTYDTDNKLRLYVDGQLKGTSAAFTRANSRTDLLTFGRRAYAGAESPFTGKIDEVRISNTARSAADILAYYTESNPQPKSTTTLPGVPTAFTGSAVSTSAINMTWSAPAGGADHYHVKYSGDGYASNIYNNATAAFDDTGRGANTSYTYRLYSVNASGAESDTYSEITKSTWVNAPVNQTATTVSNTQINLAWEAGANGANHYHVRSSSDAYATLKYDNTTASWNESGLTGNTAYTYRIYAVSVDNVENTSYVTATNTTLTNTPVLAAQTTPTNDNTPQIHSTTIDSSAANRTVKLYQGASLVATTTAAANGTFTFANGDWGANTLADGVYTDLVAKSVNSAGQESVASVALNLPTGLLIDTHAPSSSVTNNPTLPGDHNGYFVTNPVITLTAIDDAPSSGTTVHYRWGADAFATYSGTISIPAQGENTLNWYATDGAGNIESTHTETYMLDSVKPAGNISFQYEYAHFDPELLILDASDDTSGVDSVRLSNDGVTFCTIPYTQYIQWNFSGLITDDPYIYGADCGMNYGGEGANTIYFSFVDGALNVSDTQTVSIILDSIEPVNPTATVTATPAGGANGWYKSAAPTFTLTGASDATSGLDGYFVLFTTDPLAEPVVDGIYQAVNPGGDTFTPTIDPADSGKTFYLRVQARDGALNLHWGPDEANLTIFTYKYDGTNPAAISFITPSPAGWSATNNFDFAWPKTSDIDSNGASSGMDGYLYRRKLAADSDTYESWDKGSRFVAQPAGSTVNLNDIEALYTGLNVIEIKALDKVGNESAAKPVNYYYSGDIPQPTNLSVDLSQSNNMTVNRYNFSWNAPTGVTPQGYYYSVNAEPDTQNSTFIPYNEGGSTSTGFAAFATKTGLNKFYVVTKANDMVGWTNFEMAEFTCNTSAPGIPTGVMITDSSSRDSERWQLTVNWDQPAQISTDFNGYAIERSTDGTNFSEIATTGENTTGYLDTNLLNVSTYYYRVKSRDNTGNKSPASTVVSRQPTGRYTEPPKMIGDPKIEVQATKAIIDFTTERDADSFVQVGTTTTYGMTQGQLDSTSSHTVNLSGLTPGVFYHYRAMWRDIDGNIGYSKDYTFKTQDAPGISEVNVSSIGLTSAIVSWKTNTVSSSVVKYGKTNTYGSQVEDRSGSGVTVHVVKIDGLNDSTTYHFKISGTDTDGNGLSSDDYSFETLTFPRVSDVKITQKADEVTSTIVVTWSTNVPTDSVVNYSGGGTNKESSKALLEQKHSITVGNLRDNTAYTISVGGRDAYGNQAEGGSASYKTAFDTRPPQITAITTETSIVGFGIDAKGQVIVSWETDEPSTSQVEYGVGVSGDDYSQKTQEDTGLTTTHVVVMSGLKPSTSYHFQVVSKDASGNTASSEDTSFLTDQASSSVLDIIVNSLQSTIGWIFGSFARR